VRVFGYSRGCLGPIGLREQQATQIILDAGLQSEDFLLCGAGVADEVYAIPPHELVTAVGASFASISRQNC
jgi:prolyl-tRNA editing enzyme YbaK/EbsC (Cys-tRNA(Pro) deacylase)